MLGIEAYGVVGFYSMLFGVFSFANVGLTATLSRELARLTGESDSLFEMRDLTRTLELVFRGIAVGVAAIVVLLAPLIAEYWVNVQSVSIEAATNGVRLMGIAMALRFPTDLCHGGLLGLQQQIASNTIVAGMGTTRGFGAVVVLWILSPTIEAFFYWQIIVNLIESIVVSHVLWHCLGPKDKPCHFRLSSLQSTWRYAAGMTGISVVSIMLSEIDKLTVSKMLSLEAFAVYSVASIVSRAPIMIGGPIADAIFPRLTQLVQQKELTQVARLYHHGCQLVSVVAIPIGLVIAFFSRELIQIWTQNHEIANESCWPATILVLGTTSLSLLIVPYRLALSNGWTSLNLIIGAVSVVVIIPLIVVLTYLIGVVGAATGWLVLNLGITAPFIYLLHRRVLPGATWRYYLQDVAAPLISSLSILLCGRYVISENQGQVMQLIGIVAIWVLAVVAAVISVPTIRGVIATQLQSRFGLVYRSR